MGIDPSLRIITNRFIYLNLNNLMINNEGNNNLNNLNIMESHKGFLDNIYLGLIKKIKFFIQNNRIIRDIGYEMFENEFQNYQKDFSDTIENLISNPFLLVPYNLEDIVEGKIIYFSY